MPADALLDEWFADTYGYTPAEIAEMPLEAYQWFPVIRRAHNEAASLRHRQEQRMQGRG